MKLGKNRMKKMEISVITSETVNFPSHASTQPFKLSLIDQMFPSSLYFPVILFFNPPTTPLDFATQLKKSLAQTLLSFYPIAGSTLDNVYIDRFDKGVRFIETRVTNFNSLSDYLQELEIETLNLLFPCQPHLEVTEPPKEQVLVQLNRFNCGGIALGICFSHKIIDGATGSLFLKNWAANNTEMHFPDGKKKNEIKHPDLSAGSQLFPPQESNSQDIPTFIVGDHKKRKTKRFGFTSEAVEKLRLKCKGKVVKKPSRVEALTAFIWKSMVSASRSVTTVVKPSVIVQVVNLRSRTNPPLPQNAIGSLIWRGAVTHDKEEMELSELVCMQREMLQNISENGFQVIKERMKMTQDMFSKSMDRVELYGFSSWLGFGFHEINFGWGKPVWIGIFGETGVPSTNLTILKELGGSTNSVEAWITFEEEKMSILENDPEFLAFAIPNPPIKLLD
nr:labdane acetyltransferase [Cistus creticus subsp. creticus]